LDQRRKLTIIGLVVLTIFLGLGSILITQLVRNNQSPEDSFAGGFGIDATRDLYSQVAETFQVTGCEAFLQSYDLSPIVERHKLLNPERYKDFDSSKYEIWVNTNYLNMPKWCDYMINGDMAFTFYLYSYLQDSIIDNSAEELRERVNSQLISEYIVELENYTNLMKFSYGHALTNTGHTCVVNIFHEQNDFEYATLTFDGNISCEEDKELILDIARNFMRVTNEVFSVFEI
jgi:hypothetical protein